MEQTPASANLGCFEIGLFAATALLWIAATPMIFSLGGSDAAGNGLASAFAVFFQILLWIPLTLFVLLGAANSRLPGAMAASAAILAPIAAFTSIAAVAMMGRPTWIAVTPILLPPLAVAFGFWMRPGAPLPARQLRLTAAGFGAATLLLLMPPAIDHAVWIAERPEREAEMLRFQAETERAQAEAQAAREARLAALGPDSPLEDYLEFAYSSDASAQAREKLRNTRSFEADAIRMLAADQLVDLRDLWAFGVEVTPALCTSYREALSREFDRYPSPRPDHVGNPPAIQHQIRNFEWLVSEGCDLSTPLNRLAAYLRQLPAGQGVTDLTEQIDPLLRASSRSTQ